MADRLGNKILAQRFSRLTRSMKLSVRGKEKGLESDKTAKQPSTDEIQEDRKSHEKRKIFRQKLYSSFRGGQAEMKRTKVLETLRVSLTSKPVR